MRAVSMLFVGLFLLVGLSASAELSRTEAYFIRKSLNDANLKVLFHSNSKGECLPLLIGTDNDVTQNASDEQCCKIAIEKMDVTKDEQTGLATAHLIYKVENKYEVSEVFISTDLINWTTKDKSVKINLTQTK
ncbi:hypothetical protein [Alistipes sp. ZOR0009]|uniref:hypothetical protein n=1 Tax=Alistipes sp. ZOR0009 TaxID=1339253 RepID=UPI00064911AD|nr:hypothetical protein [Alistipes sp. ZOR0009]